MTPALAVACRDIDVRNVKALIIGPHETPYEFGFFEVGLPCHSFSEVNHTNITTVRLQVQQRYHVIEKGDAGVFVSKKEANSA